MKTIMISVHPEWVAKILSGEKTLDIRKTMPKCELPFKVLMYCTKHRHFALVQGGGKTSLFYACNPYTAFIVGGELANGKVVGEFICDYVEKEAVAFTEMGNLGRLYHCRLSLAELKKYAGKRTSLYYWHISALKVYDKPKELSDFYSIKQCKPWTWEEPLARPPQSWQYIQEKEECKEE